MKLFLTQNNKLAQTLCQYQQ